MLTAAKVLTALAVLSALVSLHPRLRPVIYVAWAFVAGLAVCLIVETMR
jgi:hypothetical protein